MECNKEEAVRAKQLAEKKMEIKDFSGALKIALKAQQLYHGLENISQLMLVCEVHCAAEKRLYGTDKDWYGILKVEPSADDTSIKKQYRKLALVLHPDKNSFAGATDAFKLIGEAQMVLLDREKRLVHDSKRRAFGNISAPGYKQPSRQPNVQQVHPWNRTTPVNLNGDGSGSFGSFPFQQRAPTSVNGHTSHTPPTSMFWTCCPFCSVRCKLYRNKLNENVRCGNCKETYPAYELGTHVAPTTTKTQTRQPNRVSPKPAEGAKRTFTTKPVFEKKEPPKAHGNVDRKRKKRVEESSSESADSHESSESEEDVQTKVNGEERRRSSRSKRNVSYKEKVNDIDIDIDEDGDNDDDATPSKPSEKEAKTAERDDEKSLNDKAKSDKSAKDDDTDKKESAAVECLDAEFHDFEKNRKKIYFRVGQIWACYDTEDTMPRFYALIKKISPGFKLQIIWLKPDAVTKDEIKWAALDLPVSCGRYKHEKEDKTDDILSFSHLVSWEAGPESETINIIPRKGETWAVFKNWSINWHTIYADTEEMKYEYEFVEILSDFDEKAGARVSYLEKVKGFVCLYRRKAGAEMVIPASEKYKFAHMIPSCKMSGEEQDGVPKGSFELDPAALPPAAFA